MKLRTMKIKITNKEKIIEGSLKTGYVKPFGTSGHIPFSREHLGKKVNVIVPTDADYIWVLNEKVKDEFIKAVKKEIAEQGGKLAFYRKSTIDRIDKGNFKAIDLVKSLDLLGCSDKSKEYKTLIDSIERIYV